MTFKEKVYNACSQVITDRIKLLQQTLIDLRESASNETKSTAGDKHETALAMLQIEQENTGCQLENCLAQKAVIDKIAPGNKPVHVSNGALVKTNKGYLFVSIPLGKIIVDGITIIVLSPQSPLGSKLMRLMPGESAHVNELSYVIETIE